MPQNDFTTFNSIVCYLSLINLVTFFSLSLLIFLPVFNKLKQTSFLKSSYFFNTLFINQQFNTFFLIK